MPTIGLEITSINAKREEEMGKELKIDHFQKIRDVKKKKIDALGKEVLEILFEYKCTYENSATKKNVGKIEFEGKLFYFIENLEESLKSWKKNKRLPDNITVDVFNRITRTCLTKAIGLAEDLRLPPPIRFPTARIKQS
ncbi:MAG: hypothetical protein J7L45_01915 [Candidatus Aenigmarchaeota archaeon]|nr:hypothetical protein [Candidatus Aenigmarchaeota archaeon]